MEIRDEYVLLNGLRFHFREWPNTGAQPLVLLHGVTGHARTWDTFAAAMQPRYHVYALDQRGHGESGWANDYRAECMVDDIDRFVRAIGLGRFVLLGLSMGGRNAYAYAAAFPQSVERLVIVDIGPDLMAAGSQRIRGGMQARDIFASPEEAIAAARRGNARADEAELQHRVRNNLMLLEDGTWTFRYDRSLRQLESPLPRPDAEAAWASLSHITAPTLLVRGQHSDVLSPETAARMVEVIPDCRLFEVPDAGHSVPLENPAGFLAAVRTFL